MNYIEYVIKNGKSDLLSSLKRLDDASIKKVLEDKNLNGIEELFDLILDKFNRDLNSGILTRDHLNELIENENTCLMLATPRDVESFYVFVYDDNGYLSYYLPDEIKNIISK